MQQCYEVGTDEKGWMMADHIVGIQAMTSGYWMLFIDNYWIMSVRCVCAVLSSSSAMRCIKVIYKFLLYK